VTGTVISLTTIPDRIDHIAPTVTSLLAQGLPVYVWAVAKIERIARYTGKPLVCVPAELEGQGPDPSGDYRAAKWREAYSDDDLAYFASLIPDDYWGLNG
jgi:hypothetical protein